MRHHLCHNQKFYETDIDHEVSRNPEMLPWSFFRIAFIVVAAVTSIIIMVPPELPAMNLKQLCAAS